MTYSYAERKRLRKSFAQLPNVFELPYLLQGTFDSYEYFLKGVIPSESGFEKNQKPRRGRPKKVIKRNSGLRTVIESFFPIQSHNQTAELTFIDYELEDPKYEVDECKLWGTTYSSALYASVELIFYEAPHSKVIRKKVTGERIFLGEVPRMTEKGSFLINGSERVVVSQLRRSPGVLFESDKGLVHSSGKVLYSARIIPHRGAWLDFEFDVKDTIHVRIDRKRKIPVTVLLRALGMSDQNILDDYYEKKIYKLSRGKLSLEYVPAREVGKESLVEIKHPKTGKVLVEKNSRITAAMAAALEKAGVTELTDLPDEYIIEERLGQDLIDKNTGVILGNVNQEVTPEMLDQIRQTGVDEVTTLHFNEVDCAPYISKTLLIEQPKTKDEAIVEIYQVIRPGEPVTVSDATKLFERMFFSEERYDLSRVGRMKLNLRLATELIDPPEEMLVLRPEDIRAVLRKLVKVRSGKDAVDDVDHLGNRRVRTVGEMIADQFRIGLQRIEKVVSERLGIQDAENRTPMDLVNAKPVTSALREFFGGNALSQFMDQTNALSEVSHKRRLSAMGPAGLTRERAGHEVRDVHPTHYGRLCPVETPEGPNIGLINSLACYTRVNEYGFLESPVRRVVDGKVTNEIVYISPLDDKDCIVAQSNAEIGKDGSLLEEMVTVRVNNESMTRPPQDVNFIDVAPEQIISVTTALIPFLEHNDANRALMGSNMQRQAVPPIKPVKPLVGTGIERQVAEDSGTCLVARNAGIVEYADAARIVVLIDENEQQGGSRVDIYNLAKYQRTNQDTCITQRVLVKSGDVIGKGDVLADGASVDKGELALGSNVRVAFMPWNGYNFEDSILVSERLSWDDAFTSIHIKELICRARETKMGDEEITADIPVVSEGQLEKLDTSGIIHLGAEVKSGDILVGRVTPKGDQQLTPEEKLLRAIFGEKAANVRDTSLRVPSGSDGVVVGVQILTRSDLEKDERALEIENDQIKNLEKDEDDEVRIVENITRSRVHELLIGGTVRGGRVLPKDTVITADDLKDLSLDKLDSIRLTDEQKNTGVEKAFKEFKHYRNNTKKRYDGRKERIQQSDEMPSGVRKIVKVYLAVRRRIQPGDKMAGRHGNKGVISKICATEDMPYDSNGIPVDMVLNPLGIPSRMNIGQILETHLGLAAKGLGDKIEQMLRAREKAPEIRKFLNRIYNKSSGLKVDLDQFDDTALLELAENLSDGVPLATPPFDGAAEENIRDLLTLAGLDKSGTTQLYDGLTGEAFEYPVTVGYMYMLKLNHLVEDKMHSRSTGSYSLVTQQPLGGKANFGGQRFGEMEVWALEAYGAAHTLKEILTVKSDDIQGRTNMYRNIVQGTLRLESRIPESFNVLSREIKGLALDFSIEAKETSDE